jgi:uncharacterized protein (DUF849 family)
MQKPSEIDELIAEIREKCPDIVISQITSFGEKSFESGIWKLWHKANETVHINIEVKDGLLWALYANKEFENKYPIDAIKICEFLHDFDRV